MPHSQRTSGKPKKSLTPEPGDDEPKYFTVARGQVLLEINRDYPHPERLLGEHRWSKFLKKPSVEEAGRVSQIFYSTYSTGRQAQKDGWKRINVADSWFKNWEPAPTTWCPPPPEDRTTKSMCRPLPVSVKPPPPPKAAPAPVVPGSATWVTQKGAPSTNNPTARRRAWSAVQPAGAPNAANKNTKTKSIPATSAAPWHTATAPKSSNIVPVAKNPPTSPPGLALPGEGDFSVPPGIARGPSGACSASSAETALSVSALAAGFVGITLSSSTETNLCGARAETSPDSNTYVAEWEKMPAPDADSLWLAAEYEAMKEDVAESLWGKDDDVEKKQADVILCPEHGIICQQGICREYARILREKKREKERAERDAKGGKNKNNKNNNGWKKKGANPWNDDDSGSATGSEGRSGGRSPANAKPSNDGWATAKPSNDGWTTVRGR
ncbi:hypothetical protein B0H19DRAFT_1088358 [Mycena capillaripes]|nr:hypothetical protein B0H19DRAFT_1088358 [Mycena capillaripes]